MKAVLDSHGYYASCGLDVSTGQAIIPSVKELLESARNAGLQVYWTREGHREDLSTLPSRERARSKLAGAEIGSQGLIYPLPFSLSAMERE